MARALRLPAARAIGASAWALALLPSPAFGRFLRSASGCDSDTGARCASRIKPSRLDGRPQTRLLLVRALREGPLPC
jgi:hypothetical protein